MPCKHHLYPVPKHVHPPKRKPGPIQWSFHIMLVPPALATTHLPSVLWICLFWTFHLRGIIHDVAFCVWLLSLNLRLSRLRGGDFPGGTVVKNSPANAGDTGSSPGPGRSHMPPSS